MRSKLFILLILYGLDKAFIDFKKKTNCFEERSLAHSVTADLNSLNEITGPLAKYKTVRG